MPVTQPDGTERTITDDFERSVGARRRAERVADDELAELDGDGGHADDRDGFSAVVGGGGRGGMEARRVGAGVLGMGDMVGVHDTTWTRIAQGESD
jgi:predicted Rossmann-fold nucleotide-binding protein